MANTSLQSDLLQSWQINHRITAYLVERLPGELWPKSVPGAKRRTVRMIAGHIHNSRCMWVKILGKTGYIAPPHGVDRHRVTPPELLEALEESNESVSSLIEQALARGGSLPKVAWLNIPPSIVSFVTYLSSHEAHHRGQIVMVARQLGHRLPGDVTNGLWQWSRRAKEL